MGGMYKIRALTYPARRTESCDAPVTDKKLNDKKMTDKKMPAIFLPQIFLPQMFSLR
jgi:hypothetical protein